MKKVVPLFILGIINVAAIWYLLTPVPTLFPLPQSVKSELPGDTVQISNVTAYFTNLPRAQVIPFYQQTLAAPLRIIINHPPEKAKDIISATTQSYYFEEFVFPFKGSIYINGFEWENDVFTKPEKRIKNKLEYNGIEYKSKVTIRTFPVSTPIRLACFFSLEALIIFLFFIYKSFFTRRK